MPMREIGRRMNVEMSEAILRAYRGGVQPLYVRGEALLRLWSETTGRPIDEVPRVKWHPPVRRVTRRGRVERS